MAAGILAYLVIFFILSLPRLTQPLRRRAHRIAFYTALIFICHPIRPETVIYLSSRSALLSGVFYLSSFLCFLLAAYKEKEKNYLYLLSLLFSLLALGSKESSATLPVVTLLFDFLILSKADLKELKKRWWFHTLNFLTLSYSFYLLLAGYRHNVYGRTAAAGFGTPFITPFTYLFTQFTVILYYIKVLLWPADINLDYDWHYARTLFEFPTFLSFIALIVIAAATFKLLKKKPVIAFWILWYFLTLLPESSVVPLKDVIFLHRLYLPSLGIIVLFVMLIDRLFLSMRHKGETAFFALLIFSYGYLTIQQGNIWQTEISLWEYVVNLSPKKARPHLNLGMAYKEDFPHC
jgi:hypothetical protein